MSATVLAPPVPDQPYRGIQPFRFIDQQIFVARDEEIWNLLSNVTLFRAILLYGESGTGKSSLINAGLLPRALEENFVVDRIRVQPFAGREFKVERIRTSGPGEPVDYLQSNFAFAKIGDEETFELSLTVFRERLEEFRLQREEPSSPALFSAPRTTATPLLIFDQFEEFITLFEEAQRVGPEDTMRAQKQAPATQQAILTTLVDLIQDESLPVKLIFSFREDYLAKLSLLLDFCPELIDQAQRLRPPRVEVVPKIIRAPFENKVLKAHFLKKAGETTSELSESLAYQIAADLGNNSEGGLVNLTALQIVCKRLWASPDAQGLYGESGLRGLLEAYGEDVFKDVSRELREVAVSMLGRMLTASDTRNIVSEDDLVRTSDPKQAQAALSLLVNSQLVRRETRRNIYFYEITSEYLVPWIKGQVVELKAAEQRHQAELERLKAEQNLEAQMQRSRKLKRLLTAMMLLLVIVFMLGVAAAWLYKRANANLLRAETAEAELKKQKEEAESSRDKLKGSLVTASRSQDEKVALAASEVLSEAVKTDQNLAQQLPARFYIHIASETQREPAEKLTAALKNQGYIVPAIDVTGPYKAPPRNELRYFRQQDPGMPAAKDIVALLNQSSDSPWVETYTGGYEDSPNIRPGHFELWFSAGSESAIGWLRTYPVDDYGKRIERLTFYITVTTLDGTVVRKQRSGYVPLPKGDYEVTATVDGYKPVTLKFSITPGQDNHQPFKLVKTTP